MGQKCLLLIVSFKSNLGAFLAFFLPGCQKSSTLKINKLGTVTKCLSELQSSIHK